ncbi:dTDP-4-dehydrorhamnose reductase [Dyella telluris]|uniref:dTDP-4-dehydrorhamnose reductase n=1 Tax=Dyella telluris TaxID=2763498 RepID=A0A7G8Q7H7_9GAMM|nr:dTDP-4-dehydrorhamnose reductase [Dyella telluris]QNK02735.1 dTDP-4-dehydrorhamnose reductase [Dyella telluris]
MKILLLGANGQLGQTFLKESALTTFGEVVPVTRDGQLSGGMTGVAGDLSSPEGMTAVLDRVQPDVIINAAAFTAVDRAEQEEKLATRVNGESVGAIGAWAASNDALVLHYSTDYVFDGSSAEPYAVDAATAPLGAYGRSKLAGERALAGSGARHMIFRTAWVYAAHGHNFLRTMLRLGAERDELRIVADQHGAPTSTGLIVRGTLAALDVWSKASGNERSKLEGTHHLVASGTTTWHGFAVAIFDEAFRRGLIAKKPVVTPIDTADFPTPAKRPAYSVLENADFQKRFGFVLPDWQQGLLDVMGELSIPTH